VALWSAQLEASRAFWTETMGYVVEWEPDPDNVYLTSGRDNLALHRGGPRTGEGGPLDHVGLAVPRAEDVDAWAAHLQARGVALEKPVRQHRDGSRSLYFREPGGVLVQIIHHRPLCG
jgi:catechol 2,3-dioxygenase-like lactoylglutathione lyase family enzyme